MNITIIGAGNMGTALTSAFTKSQITSSLTIANRSETRLQNLQTRFPDAKLTTDIQSSVSGADLVVIAVKPYAVEAIASVIADVIKPSAIILSVAAGVSLDRLAGLFCSKGAHPLMYAIPNTAVSIGKGITFIASRGCDNDTRVAIESLMAATGRVEFVDESAMTAVTALCSCGIAYVYKFIQAGVQAGVEMGLRPADALAWFTATVAGAAAMLETNGRLPQQEIDAVTTPGGMTIKGVNALEHAGFTSAVIDAILRPLK